MRPDTEMVLYQLVSDLMASGLTIDQASDVVESRLVDVCEELQAESEGEE